jgi:hypothetical protein
VLAVPARLPVVTRSADFVAEAPVLATAVHVRLTATLHSILGRFVERLPMDLPESGMALFRAELADASLARVEDDEMVIDVWHPGQRPHQVRRK